MLADAQILLYFIGQLKLQKRGQSEMQFISEITIWSFRKPNPGPHGPSDKRIGAKTFTSQECARDNQIKMG
jgi:hypothetical protein